MSDLYVVVCAWCPPVRVIGCKLVGNADQNWACQACERKECAIKQNSGLFQHTSGICEYHLKEQKDSLKNESALLRQ